jgi:MFS family permease
MVAGRPIAPRFWAIWSADVAVRCGAQLTGLALPLIAVLSLDATAGQMGLLVALESAPALAFGLVIGVWVDRVSKRHLLIAANLAQATALALVPVFWLTGRLSLAWLLVAALAGGACRPLFDIAFRSYVPSVVDRALLLRANSRLELGRSAAEIGGTAVAGVLLQISAAPVALAVDGITRLASSLLLGFAPVDTSSPADDTHERATLRDAFAGVSQVHQSGILRPLASALVLAGFFNGAVEALFLLFIARELGLAPLTIGLIFACGSIGFIVGALAPERLAAKVGLGWSLVVSLALIGISDLLVPLAAGPRFAIVALLAAAQFLFGVGLTAFSANEVTLRQTASSQRLIGRVNAVFYVFTHGAAPLGALAGGLMGSALGFRAALACAAAGELLALLPLLHARFRAALATEHARAAEST